MSASARSSEGELMTNGEEGKATGMPPKGEGNQAVEEIAALHLQPNLGDGNQLRLREMNAPSSSSGPALLPVPRPVSSEMVDVGRELSPPSSDENNNERPLAFFETLFRDENGFKPQSVANIHMKVKSTYTEWTKGPFKLNWDEMEFLRTCILNKYWSQVKMEDWKLLENALKGRMILLEEDRLRRCRPRDARWAIKALRDSSSKIDGKVPRASVSNNEEAAAVDFDNPQLEPDIENRVNASLANDGLAAKSAESIIVKSSNEKKFSDLRNGESKRAHDYDLRKDKVEADFKTAAFIVMQKREMSLQLGRSQNDESPQLGEVNSNVVLQDPGPVENNDTDLAHNEHDTKQPSLSVKKGQAVVAAKSKVKYLWTTRKEDQINLTLDEDFGKYEVSKPRKICLLIKDKIVELEDYHKYMQESDFIIPQDPDDRTDMPPLPKPTVFNCHALNCRYGCICECMNVKKKRRRLHCGQTDCMLNCKCPPKPLP